MAGSPSPSTMTARTTTLYYFPPGDPSAPFPSPFERGPFHAAFGPIPPLATRTLQLSSPSAINLLTKYKANALQFDSSLRDYSSSGHNREYYQFKRLAPLVLLDIYRPAQSILQADFAQVWPATRHEMFDKSHWGFARTKWLEEAHQVLCSSVRQRLGVGEGEGEEGDESWEEDGRRDQFLEMQVLAEILNKWDVAFGE